jgi:hypothetical protein
LENVPADGMTVDLSLLATMNGKSLLVLAICIEGVQNLYAQYDENGVYLTLD